MKVIYSKCLESYLIDNYEIANEGIFNKMTGKFKNSNNSKSVDYSKMSNKKLNINSKSLRNIDVKYKFSSMTEDQYNNFFIKLKTKCFRCINSLCNEFNNNAEFIQNKNSNYKLKIIPGYYKGIKFKVKNNKCNQIIFGVLQYNYDYTENTFPKAALEKLNLEFKDLNSNKVINFVYTNSSFYFEYLNYNTFMKFINM